MIESPLWSIAVMSDLHVMAWKETNAPVEWVPQVQEAVADIASLKPSLLVIEGDLTNGKVRDYRLARQILTAHCDFPIHYTMGNHEYYGYYEEEAWSDEAAQTRFFQETGMSSLHTVIDAGPLPLICLSTEHYAPDLGDAGWISDASLAWLAEELAARRGQAVGVIFHQPLDDTVAESTNTCVQSEGFRRTLEMHGDVLFLSGHTHCRMDRPDQLVQDHGVLFVGGGCPHGDHPQSRWIDVYSDRIVIRIRDHVGRRWLTDWDHTHRSPNARPHP